VTTFQRARSDEQREVRRRAILDTAAAMLTEMPVAQLSLNELARRVGLAKSNVLRYFESREAVLLELLDVALAEWLDALARELPESVSAGAPAQQRTEQLAARLAGSLADRPVLCDLVSAQAAVLERNVSAKVAAQYKRSTVGHAQQFGRLVAAAIPELGDDSGLLFAGATMMATGAVWAHSQPSAAMLAAYQAEPELAALRLDFGTTLRELLAVLLAGLLARPGGGPPNPS
jgi:AcrR family transcriptional regulator